MTSCGFTLPRVAWLSVRISVIVMTMVTSTTRLAPQLRASSLRREEWNNIGAIEKQRIMDFELKTLSLAGAAGEKCDALILLVDDSFKPGKDALSKLAAEALKAGHLEAKPGKLLHAYRTAGISGPRALLASCGDGSAKRIHSAVHAAVSSLRTSSVKRLLICLPQEADDDTVRAAVVATAEASYVY